jgi:hypothetical protein
VVNTTGQTRRSTRRETLSSFPASLAPPAIQGPSPFTPLHIRHAPHARIHILLRWDSHRGCPATFRQRIPQDAPKSRLGTRRATCKPNPALSCAATMCRRGGKLASDRAGRMNTRASNGPPWRNRCLTPDPLCAQNAVGRPGVCGYATAFAAH